MTEIDVYGPEGAATVTGPEAPRVRRRKPWTARRAITWGVVVVAIVVFVLWARAKIDGLSEETQAANPIMRWEWLFLRDSTAGRAPRGAQRAPQADDHPGRARVCSSPRCCRRSPSASAGPSRPITAIAGFLYTIPSMALFGALGSRYSYFTAAVIALTSYTLLILIRNIVAGIDSVPAGGDRRGRRPGAVAHRVDSSAVELPLALPVIIAGLRVAMVTTIGLVAITGDHPARWLRRARARRLPERVLHEDRGRLGGVDRCSPIAFDLGLNRLEIVLTPWLRRQGPVIASLLAQSRRSRPT